MTDADWPAWPDHPARALEKPDDPAIFKREYQAEWTPQPDPALDARTTTSCRECRAGEHEKCDDNQMRFCTCRMEEHMLPVRPNPARAMRGSLTYSAPEYLESE